ncbi:MAG: hypothetical protein ACR2P1_22320 [Pseudomonadales bacterium]
MIGFKNAPQNAWVNMPMRFVPFFLACAVGACGGGGSSGGGDAPTPIGPQVSLSGTITYTRVPSAADGFGLDYGSAIDKPARGVVVEALSANDTVLDSTVTAANGAYSLSVSENTDVKVRAKAQMLQTGNPGWDVSVTDNTQGNALYSLTGGLVNSGTTDSSRDLLAPSGWDGSSYSGTRVAAPFAILDTVYNAQQVYLEAQPGTVFEPLELRWSENNVTSDGSLENGEIGTTFYDVNIQVIYVLGFENNDTDEYDESVIAHEWWHYVEDVLLRSENLGGPHTSGDRLDMRVAFSEGVGNGWSAVANGSPIYIDTQSANQSGGFNFSLESNNGRNPGWYSESSVQSIFYDLLDAGATDDDNLSISLATVITALATEHKQSPAFASIFTFVSALKNQSSANAFEIDQLVEAQSIESAGNDEFGKTETNAAGNVNVLPVYTSLVVDSVAGQNVCSINSFGNGNKLSNFRFLRFNIANTASYSITATRTTGLQPSDPDFIVYRNGEVIVRATSMTTADLEQTTVNLTPGEYVMQVAEFTNARDGGGGETCFDVRIETQ